MKFPIKVREQRNLILLQERGDEEQQLSELSLMHSRSNLISSAVMPSQVSKSKSKQKDSKQKSKEKKSKQKQSSKPPKAQSKKKAELSKSKSQIKDQTSLSIPVVQTEILCAHHGQFMLYFCEVCQEPTCPSCISTGPHNNSLHRINKIADSYKQRVYFMSQSIKHHMLQKRDKIIAQLHRIEYRVEQIKYVSSIIDRDIRGYYGGIMERLNSQTGRRTAILNHDMTTLQRDIDLINEVGNKFFKLCMVQSPNLGKFLNLSKNLYEAADYIKSKSFKRQIDISTGDLPNQLVEQQQLLNRAFSLQALEKFKNDIIWRLQNQRKDDQTLARDVQSQFATQLQRLQQDVKQLKARKLQMMMVCNFCGAKLNKETVNGTCSKNQGNVEVSNLTEQLPGNQFLGNGFHFFSSLKG